MAFKLKDIFSNIGSKANKEGTSYRAPSSSGDIKKEMDWKYGRGEFTKGKRRKPGESKFSYDVRMKKEGHKATSEPTAREKFEQRTKKDGSVEVDFSLTGQDFLDQNKSNIKKKSPTKRGLGNYSRGGYKMKNQKSPARNYKKGYYGA